MARDDKKTSPAPKNGAAEKKEVAAKKRRGPAEGQDHARCRPTEGRER